MRNHRLALGLILVFAGLSLQAQTKEQAISVTGRLTRAVAIGGESTGWMIQLDAETNIDGKQVSSIEVSYRRVSSLEKLADKRVKATGKLLHRHGVETGERTILEITSIKEIEDTSHEARPTSGAFSLSGSEWLLEDLGGSRVLDQIQATLTFPEAGKVAGNGSCNRFFGAVEIHGDAIKLGPLGSTRMACPEAVMNQETKYLQPLQAAERFEWKDPYLLIYCKGFAKPLRLPVWQRTKRRLNKKRRWRDELAATKAWQGRTSQRRAGRPFGYRLRVKPCTYEAGDDAAKGRPGTTSSCNLGSAAGM